MRYRHRYRWTLLLLVSFPLAEYAQLVLAQPPTATTVPSMVEPPKDLAGFRAIENQIKALVPQVLPAVVGIHVGDVSASGVIVSEDGLVLTASHVFNKPGQEVTFFFSDGKKAKGITLGMFTSADAGLMKITDPGKWPMVEKGQSSTIKQGSWCVAVGHPLGFQEGRPPVIRIGRVLQVADGVIQTDCPLVGGDSGGPLLDLEGKVIGIHSRIGGPTDINLHVPIDVFNTHWERLVKGDLWSELLPGRESPEIKATFRQVVAKVNPCVVRVRCDGQDGLLGTIVGPDGWVLTKASELKGKISCRLRDGREFDARIVGIHASCDLAMLKIEANELPMIPWTTKQPSVGRWLASAGLYDDPLALGIVSTPRRGIPPVGGVIGVKLSEREGDAQIELVLPKTPAEKAGLKANDIITHVDGDVAHDTAEVRSLIHQHRPGEIIKLTIERGHQTLEISVQLAKLSTPALKQQEMMNSMGVGVSRRSDDFPAVLQHDAVIKPIDCGGPVVDLSGNAVGINIAHAGRAETYCLPADLLLSVMYDLMSGRLSPVLLEATNKAVEDESATVELKSEEKLPERENGPEK